MHAICLKLWTWYREWPQNGNAMNACVSLGPYSHDMLMKFMLMPYKAKIVLDLLLYTRKGDGNDANSIPFVP